MSYILEVSFSSFLAVISGMQPLESATEPSAFVSTLILVINVQHSMQNYILTMLPYVHHCQA